MAEGGMSCVKFLLFVFNFLFVISGIAILSLGIIVQLAYKDYLNFVGEKAVSAPILLIAVGVIIFIVAFFGCCGALGEKRFLIDVFIFLLAVIFILELAAGIVAYVYKENVNDYINTNMQHSLGQYNGTEDAIITKTWNMVQHDLKCCGINGPNDWKTANNTHIGHNLPDSCCKEDKSGCGAGALNGDIDPEDFYTSGCYKKLVSFVDSHIEWIGGIGVGIAFVQIVGIVLACCMRQSLKSTYETV